MVQGEDTAAREYGLGARSACARGVLCVIYCLYMWLDCKHKLLGMCIRPVYLFLQRCSLMCAWYRQVHWGRPFVLFCSGLCLV